MASDEPLGAPISALDIAVQELAGYFKNPSLIDPQMQSQQAQEDSDEQLRRLIFGAPVGAMNIEETVDSLVSKAGSAEDASLPVIIWGPPDKTFNTFDGFFTIPSRYEKGGSINDIVGIAPNANDATLSVMTVMSHIHGPSMRDANALQLSSTPFLRSSCHCVSLT